MSIFPSSVVSLLFSMLVGQCRADKIQSSHSIPNDGTARRRISFFILKPALSHHRWLIHIRTHKCAWPTARASGRAIWASVESRNSSKHTNSTPSVVNSSSTAKDLSKSCPRPSPYPSVFPQKLALPKESHGCSFARTASPCVQTVNINWCCDDMLFCCDSIRCVATQHLCLCFLLCCDALFCVVLLRLGVVFCSVAICVGAMCCVVLFPRSCSLNTAQSLSCSLSIPLDLPLSLSLALS